GLSAHGQHCKLVAASPVEIIVSARANESRLDRIAVGNRRGQENAVTPDDWCGMALARQCGLPANVLGLAPFNRRLSVGRDPTEKWSAPLRPGIHRFHLPRSESAGSPGAHAMIRIQMNNGMKSPFRRRPQSSDHTQSCAERHTVVADPLHKPLESCTCETDLAVGSLEADTAGPALAFEV